MHIVPLTAWRPISARFVATLWLIVISSLSAAQSKGQPKVNAGAVNGSVITIDASGSSYVPGANVVLSGQTELRTESDAEGKFKFAAVPPGTYSITANAPNLVSQPIIVEVEADATSDLKLQLSPAEVKSSIDVTAAEERVSTSSTTSTIDEKTVISAPNQNDKAESLLPLIPGVVRGPDGRINMKGARNTQSGALVNSANVTDPATGSPGLDLPIDVVSSVQVISNPYDPQYGKLTGAVSTVETKTSNYEKLHFSIQNIAPRVRVRDGSVLGVGGATPRMTLTGPLMKERIAFTQSLEYRYIRTPVNSLAGDERDTTFEGVNSYNQVDLNISDKQTATISASFYPQKLKYMGLNTFTPQPSTGDYHQRGNQLYAQHRYVTRSGGLLTSQFSYKTFDADVSNHNTEPYRLLVETTEGGSFDLQARRSSRYDWQELYQFAPRHVLGTHQLKAGFNYAYSKYNGQQTYLPVEIDNLSASPIERIHFGDANWARIHQHETSWFLSDQWTPASRLSVDLGFRGDTDSVTSSVHASPRVGVQIALTGDGKTMLKGGAGLFYDRVQLMIAGFNSLPDRSVSYIDSDGAVSDAIHYENRIAGGLQNPRSTAWSVSLSRHVVQPLILEVGYEHRQTSHDFVVSPLTQGSLGYIELNNTGAQSYQEFKVVGKYTFRGQVLNASYVRSRAYGNLNDFFQFFGNTPKSVIQPQAEGRLSFDAPDRFLAWGDFHLPWKVNLLPVFDIHSGFPYSVQNEYREYIGQRNSQRYPRFSSLDAQVLRPFSIHAAGHHLRARAGFSVFNLLGHFNPRDVQTIQASPRFGEFFNDAWREYRGKLVFEF